MLRFGIRVQPGTKSSPVATSQVWQEIVPMLLVASDSLYRRVREILHGPGADLQRIAATRRHIAGRDLSRLVVSKTVAP